MSSPNPCICVFFPDPLSEQGGFAVRRETARQRHAVADLYRRAGLRECGTGEYQCGQHPQSGGAREAQAERHLSAQRIMASASALRQLASAKLPYFQIMRLDPLATTAYPRRLRR